MAVIDEKLRVGPAYVWANPIINSQGLVDLTIVQDSSELIAPGVPRPLLTPPAIFMGYTLGIRQSFDSGYKEQRAQGALSFTQVYVQQENFSVGGSLIFNDDPTVLKLLLPPGGSSSVDIYGGGQTDVPLYSLLLILMNRLRETDIVTCFLYYRGYFKSVEIESSSRDFHSIDFNYIVGSGLDTDGCLLAAGARDYRVWWVNKYTGELTNPILPPNTTIPELQIYNDYYPLTMIGL